jgi:hypothetical protein
MGAKTITPADVLPLGPMRPDGMNTAEVDGKLCQLCTLCAKAFAMGNAAWNAHEKGTEHRRNVEAFRRVNARPAPAAVDDAAATLAVAAFAGKPSLRPVKPARLQQEIAALLADGRARSAGMMAALLRKSPQNVNNAVQKMVEAGVLEWRKEHLGYDPVTRKWDNPKTGWGNKLYSLRARNDD